jgi:hypothetical protein
MYVLYYASMLRCWHLVWILVRTDNPYLGVECHNMTGTYMMEVEDMDIVEERSSKPRLEVEGIDMIEDTMAEVDVEVVEREHEGVVLVKHWTDNGAERHR